MSDMFESNSKAAAEGIDEGRKMPISSEEDTGFPVIGIGFSAGGLAALESFFAHMPDEPALDMALIIIPHLKTEQMSPLSDLVRKCSSLPVCHAEDGMVIKAGRIYIVPSDQGLTVEQGRLCRNGIISPTARHLPIDTFFQGLAHDQAERSICILLSGAGTDGTLGVRAIKCSGGMIMVQEPRSAGYASMPASAINTGLVDYVLKPEEMPTRLIAYLKRNSARIARNDCSSTAPPTDWLKKIIAKLYAYTGHNFSGYKQGTISRRVERRLAVNLIEHEEEYLRYLEHDPREAEALFRDLLVGVTQFFRDPEAFAAIEERVIPHLHEENNRYGPIRIWIAGCSTGEEAYSLAILLHEHRQKLSRPLVVQIFATDIDERAIDIARAGVYPVGIAASVSAERLENFFVHDPESNVYRIQRSIRDMVVFAKQDVAKDPPFSRCDLVSCRNLLIYMDSELQKKVLQMFHYALRKDGFLFLGTAETVGVPQLFSIVDGKWRIYQAKGRVRPAHVKSTPLPWYGMTLAAVGPKLPYPHTEASAQPLSHRQGETMSIRQRVEGLWLQHYTPAFVLVNRHGEVAFIHGRTGRFLEPASGEVSLNIVQMARGGLKLELAAGIRKAMLHGESSLYRGLKAKGNGQTVTVDLSIHPVLDEIPEYPGAIMVVFADAMLPLGGEGWEEVAATRPMVLGDRDHLLEQELRDREEYVQAVTDEMESSREELQSVSEEYQSTIEELETSKEELQSVTEELMIVNTELHENMDDLMRANNDMNNMLAGTGVGTIFVDCDMIIKRFTPPVNQVIQLLSSDIGRPLSHLALNLIGYSRLVEDVQEVLDSLKPKGLEVQSRSNTWYLMRILPYRTLDNSVEGAVINFADITELKELQSRDLQRMARLAVVVRDSSDAVMLHNFSGQIRAWNPGSERLYGWTEEEALMMNVLDCIPENRRAEGLERLERLAAQEVLEPVRRQRLTKAGSIVDIWLIESVLIDSEGKPYAIATTARQIHRKEGEDERRGV